MATANTAIQQIKIGNDTYNLPVVDTESSAVTATNYNAAGVNLLFNAVEQLTAIINQLDTLKFEIVEELPTSNISRKTIYLVPGAGTTEETNYYDEFVWITDESGDHWERIGSTKTETVISYANLTNKPSLNNVTLSGNKTVSASSTGTTTLTGSVTGNVLTITAGTTVATDISIS